MKGFPVEPRLLTFLNQWRPFTISRPDNTPTRACALPQIHSAILPLDQSPKRRLLHQRLPQQQECMSLSQSQTQQISQRQFAILSPSTNKTITLAIKLEVNRQRKCSISISFFFTDCSSYLFIQSCSQQPSTIRPTISIRRL